MHEELQQIQLERWVHGSLRDSGRTVSLLRQLGISHVGCRPDAGLVGALADAGIKPIVCSGAYSKRREDGDHLQCVSITGTREVWFGSNCPSQPLVRERHLEAVRRMAGLPGVAGIYLDGARFASPASGTAAFFTCFCPACETRAEELGFDFAAMRRDVAILYKKLSKLKVEGSKFSAAMDLLNLLIELPGVYEWLRFRAAATIAHLREVRQILHEMNHRLLLGMYIFTPALAGLVGQPYAGLTDIIDIFSPMIYRQGPWPNGIACLNTELGSMIEALAELSGVPGERCAEFVCYACGFIGTGIGVGTSGLSSGLSPEREHLDYRQIREALPPQVIKLETSRARLGIGPQKKLVPILWLDDDEIAASIAAAREGGADGVSFYVLRDGNEALLEKAVAAI
ncbi:MAG TPA: hypothetical protein GXX29_09120 [Firmicutes bacterium]|nr:hypothetical protein [Bacillota bacterium]